MPSESLKTVLICGFALFAMFFGSGNLVFPLKIGQAIGGEWFFGFLGLLLSGVVLPFLGLFVIQRFDGDTDKFFKGAGSLAGIFIPFVTLALMGSFGVIPRCITVAHGGIEFLFPHIPLFVTSLIFCLITYVLCLQNESIVQTIGKWLSPFKLLSIFLLIVVGIVFAPPTRIHISSLQAMTSGVTTGYQTMDLFAAFFFSALTFSHMKTVISEKNLLAFALRPAFLGAGLIGAMYLGFVYLGAHYEFLIKDVSPEAMLPTIAMYTMGRHSTLFIAVIMSVSCLTTAVALNTVYARYLASLFKTIPFSWILVFTTLTSYVISLASFTGISQFLGPILETMYPGLIVLTIMSFFDQTPSLSKKIAFYVVTGGMIVKAFL